MSIFPGRHSAKIEGDFVVFLIGMRINRPAVYGNMPRIGLAKVAEHVPVGTTSTAARRLGDPHADEPPVVAY